MTKETAKTKIQHRLLPRRRFMVMAGSALGAAALAAGGIGAAAARPVKWNGSALGAKASILLYHSDPDFARQQLARCQAEIDRLENLFSLYRPASAICRLNRDGYLDNPDFAFLELLSQAKAFSVQSGGLFDVTVQPLWQLYAAHFSNSAANPAGPAPEAISRVLTRVGSRYIRLSSARISFAKNNMAVTFNGIAQGYVTDRITGLLRQAGFENVLVSLGESFALGTKPDGSDWRAGIVSAEDGETIIRTVDLIDRALATSGGYGSPFAPQSNINHLLDPRSGKSSPLHRSVSVVADTAVRADMVSTALSLVDEVRGREIARAGGGVDQVIYA